MQEIDIQNKLADWQKRMDAKKAAETEHHRLIEEKKQEEMRLRRIALPHSQQRTGRSTPKP